MAQGLELTGLAGIIALSLPLAALVTVVLLGTRSRRLRTRSAQKRKTDEQAAAGAHEPARAASTPEVGLAPALAGPLLDERIATAEKAGAETELVSLYIDKARAVAGAGETTRAADFLRKSLLISARLGLKEAHALARLELGDLARGEGDLTTACEHWQIARGLFHEIGMSAELKSIEVRMRDHGCPTDWVLNDF